MSNHSMFEYKPGKILKGNANNKSMMQLAWVNTIMYWVIRLITAVTLLLVAIGMH